MRSFNKRSDVFCISLLSKEQYEEAISTVPGIPFQTYGYFWLRSPRGHISHRQVVVDPNGVVQDGAAVFDPAIGVRPVFLLSNYNGTKGEKIEIYGCICTIIEKTVAFADKIILRTLFDEHSNEWKTSELRNTIEQKVFDALKGGIAE